jgi:hypothetical protein
MGMTRMRQLAAAGAVAALLTGALAGSAGAAGGDKGPRGGEDRAGRTQSPAQICKAINNTFPPDPGRPFPFVFQSTGACVSSVAQGFPDSYVLSGSAFASQCKFLEAVVPIVYPYAFYGNPNYVAKNRGDCIKFLTAFHYGQLPPGPGGD